VAGLAQPHVHGLQRAIERVQHEAKNFKSYDAKKCIIAGFAQNNGCVALTLRQSNETLAHIPLDLRAISERKRHAALRLELKRSPYVVWQKCIDRTAVNKESDTLAMPVTADLPINVR
jgi:hypothetical protein